MNSIYFLAMPKSKKVRLKLRVNILKKYIFLNPCKSWKTVEAMALLMLTMGVKKVENKYKQHGGLQKIAAC